MLPSDWQVELVRIGDVTTASLRALREQLIHVLAHPVWISEQTLDPALSFDEDRRQYDAPMLLEALLDSQSVPGTKRLGVAEVDLFQPVFTHIFGCAQLGGTVAVTSTHRLRPEFSGDPADPEKVPARLLREALHELGHTLGLRHCRVALCVMNSSRLPEHIDIKDAAFCDTCSAHICVPPTAFRPRQR